MSCTDVCMYVFIYLCIRSPGAKPVKSHEILVLLLRLRQICCHAGLIHSMLDDEQYEGSAMDRSGGNANPEMDLLGELACLNIEQEEADGKDGVSSLSCILVFLNHLPPLQKYAQRRKGV